MQCRHTQPLVAVMHHHSTTLSDCGAIAASVHGPGHVHSLHQRGSVTVSEGTSHEDSVHLLCRAAPALKYPLIGVSVHSPVVGSVFDTITSG